MKSLWTCRWAENLESALVYDIFSKNFTDIDLSTENNEKLLTLAISALQSFVQDNFVGPLLNDDDSFNKLSWHDNAKQIEVASLRNYLISDGEEINRNVSHSELLALAKFLFSHIKSNFETIDDPVEKFICQHWLLRFYGVHQLVIDENTKTLFNNISNSSDELIKLLQSIDVIDLESKVICLLEIVQWHLHFKRIHNAKENLQMAQQTLNVNISIEGKLGVRTKYQQKPLPQLMLRVDSDDPNENIDDVPSIESPTASNKLPLLLQLDDDVLLERIQFVNEADNEFTRTKSVVQAFILATL